MGSKKVEEALDALARASLYQAAKASVKIDEGIPEELRKAEAEREALIKEGKSTEEIDRWIEILKAM